MISEILNVAELAKRGYDYWETRGAPFHRYEFMQKYITFLRDSIDMVPNINALPVEEIPAAMTGLLQTTAAIVHAYHGSEKVAVNANLMVPMAPTRPLRDQAKFVRKDREVDSFRGFLHLEQWAYPDGNCPTVVLPVEKEGAMDPQLLGAPECFVTGKMQLIGDTLDIHNQLLDHENYSIRKEVGDFFDGQKKRLRSFVSFPLLPPKNVAHSCPHSVLAVVNIDANRKHLTGMHFANQHKLGLALEPVIHILSHFVVRRYYRPAAVGTTP